VYRLKTVCIVLDMLKRDQIGKIEREIQQCKEHMNTVVVISIYSYDLFQERREKAKDLHSYLMRKLDALKQNEKDWSYLLPHIQTALHEYKETIQLLKGGEEKYGR
jgi:hypothetical protein